MRMQSTRLQGKKKPQTNSEEDEAFIGSKQTAQTLIRLAVDFVLTSDSEKEINDPKQRIVFFSSLPFHFFFFFTAPVILHL